MQSTAALKIEDVATPQGVVRVVTLQDTARRNALTPEAISALSEVINGVERDEDVGALVVAHAGTTFCAGTDLTHLTSLGDDVERTRAFLADVVGLIRHLEQSSKFTVAAIEGAAVGGGFELALACDVRVLGAHAWARLPEMTLGALPGGAGVQRLTRFVGRGRTSRMVLLAERVDARACADLGLGILVEPGTALDAALAMATTVTGYSRTAVSSAKRVMRQAEGPVLEGLDAIAVEAMVHALASREGVEGLDALREQRAPDFHGARGGNHRA